jgi:hypothetical protein
MPAKPKHFSQVCIGEVSIQIASESPEDVTLVPALGAFRANSQSPHVRMQVHWVDKLCHSECSRLFDSGSVWRLYACVEGFCFDFVASALDARPYKRLTIDREFRNARLEMSTDFFASSGYEAAPLEYPLDELLIMHRLTQEKAIELHGTGIVRADGIGNLFVGHSGAGKSTTTRLWTALEEVEVLSDDRIIVRRDEKAEKQVPQIRFANRRNDSINSAPSSLVDNSKYKLRMYGTPWHGEAMYASPNSAPLARIFVLEHGRGNVITQLSPSQAVAELFARAFVPFHRHEYVESALTFLEEVVDLIPVYRYAFEPDERAVEKIIHFHD